tara:strand:+ start:228 stop:683 length:456 start_codon:yes stop_codon:yes gene_type:complete
MNNKYINIYNNLVNLTRNKELYKYLSKEDSFSDRLMMFLFHFAFFLKVFKNNSDKKTLQNIFDFIFRNLEVSIREIGYGDASINKKMKTYVNVFYDILVKIDNWSNMSKFEKNEILKNYLYLDIEPNDLVDYFDNYMLKLSNSTLNSFINV